MNNLTISKFKKQNYINFQANPFNSQNNISFGIKRKNKLNNDVLEVSKTPSNSKSDKNEKQNFLSKIKNFPKEIKNRFDNLTTGNKVALTTIGLTTVGISIYALATSLLAAKGKPVFELAKFDETPILDGISEIGDLDKVIAEKTQDVTLTSILDKNSSRTDIQNALFEYSGNKGNKVQDYWSDKVNEIIDEITQNEHKKTALGYILPFFGKEEQKTDFSYYNFTELTQKVKQISNSNDVDDLVELLKYSKKMNLEKRDLTTIQNALEDIKPKEITRFLELDSKITDGDQYLYEKFPLTSRLKYSDKKPTSTDMVDFLKLFKKGHLQFQWDGYDTAFDIVADKSINLRSLNKFMTSLSPEATQTIKINDIPYIFQNQITTPKSLSKDLNKLSSEQIKDVRQIGLNTYINFKNFSNVKNIQELDLAQRRDFMHALVNSQYYPSGSATKLFPILPKNQQEYCTLLQKLSNSIGIPSKPLSKAQLEQFDKSLFSLMDDIKKLDLQDGFLSLKMGRDEFVTQISKKLNSYSPSEIKQITNHLGFEIKDGVLSGYPITMSKDYLSKISNSKVRNGVSSIAPIVEEFTSPTKNPLTVKTNDSKIKEEFETIFNALPELRPMVNKAQHKTHKFNLDIHTLRVLQNVCSNPEFDKLSADDKKTLAISSILHDITKKEGMRDFTHPTESAFDAYYIVKKFNLDRNQEHKIYELIKTHNWLQLLNNPKLEPIEVEGLAQDIAFETRHTNTFEMAKILCQADMKSVREDTTFWDKLSGTFDEFSSKVDKYLKQIKATEIILPATVQPKASKVVGAQTKTYQGITNKVLYMPDLEEDLSKYGFAKGTTKTNWLAIVHALDQEDKMSRFTTMGTIENEALLSVSHMDLDSYHVFRKQGLILDVAYDDIHAGSFKDFGTGCGKIIELLKQDYLFYGDKVRKRTQIPGASARCDRSENRRYIPDLIKNKMGLNDEEYIKRIENILDCPSITDIEKKDKELADALLDIFKNMKKGRRAYGREYNENLISRPNIQAVFSYGQDYEKIPKFLRKYAQDNDKIVVMLGD